MIVLLDGIKQNVIDVRITRKLPEIGSLEPSRASVVLNNTDLKFKTNPATNKIEYNGTVIDKNLEIIIEDNGIRLFTGFTDIPYLDLKQKTLTIEAHDWTALLQKRKLPAKFYLNSTLYEILIDILPTMDYTNIYNVSYLIDYFIIEKETTMYDAIQKLIKSVGGRFWFDEYNKPVFDGGFVKELAGFDTTTIDDLRKFSLNDPNHKINEQIDRIYIESKTLKQSETLDYVYINKDIEVNTDPFPEGTNQFIVQFDNPVYYLDSYANVEIDADIGVTLDEATYNSNFLSGNIPKNPNEILLKFNGGYSGAKVNLIKIKGKILVEESYIAEEGTIAENTTDESFTQDLIQNAEWCSNLAQFIYREKHNRPDFSITVPEFDRVVTKGYNLSKKINIFLEDENVSNRMIIQEIVYSGKRKITLNLKYDAGNSFVPDTKPTKILVPSKQENISEIINVTEEYKEKFSGIAPNTPTGLILNTYFVDRKSYIKATWNANTETYFRNYIIEFKYNGGTYSTIGAPDTPEFVIEVEPNKIVYINIKAISFDNFISSGIESNITSAIGTTPGSISTVYAYAGFGRIFVSWTKSNDLNFAGYKIERNKDSEGWIVVQNTNANNYTDTDIITDSNYQYKITVVDIFGNESISVLSTTVTGKAQIITTEITDDSISTPKLQTNSVTADKINVIDLSAINADLGTITAGILQSSDEKFKMDLDNKTFLISTSDGSQKMEYNTTDGLSVFGASINLSSTTGEINFTDSGWRILDDGVSGGFYKLLMSKSGSPYFFSYSTSITEIHLKLGTPSGNLDLTYNDATKGSLYCDEIHLNANNGFISLSAYNGLISLHSSLGLKLPNLTSNPSPTSSFESAIYYNLTDNSIKYYDGSSWQTISKSKVLTYSSKPATAPTMNAGDMVLWQDKVFMKLQDGSYAKIHEGPGYTSWADIPS